MTTTDELLRKEKELYGPHHRKLITRAQYEVMWAKGLATQVFEGVDLGHRPTVKLILPMRGASGSSPSLTQTSP